MRTIGRILLVLVVVLGLAIVALSFVDLGRFSPQIEAAAEKATGRSLKIEGPLHIGISLLPELVAEKVSFANAPWGTRPQMVTADKLAIKIALLPLLKGQIGVQSVELDGADIYIETDKNGTGNWVFGSSTPAQPTAETSSGGTPSLAGIPKVSITNLKIAYRDGKTQKVTKADFKKISLVPSGSGVHATIEGDVNGSTIAFDADVDQTASDIALKNATLTAAGTSVKGDISVALGGAKPAITGALSSDKFDVTPLASGGGSGSGKSGPLFSRDPLPLDQLNAANVDFTVSIGSLIYKGVALENLKIPVKLKDGVLNVPVSLSYRGTPINVALTGNGNARSIGLDAKTTDLDFGKLLADLDVTNLLAAKADIAAKLSGHGNSLHDIAASTNGATNFALGTGTINSKMFALVSNDLVNAIIPNGQSGDTAKLTCVLSAFDFKNGVGTSKALAAETDSLITTGSGTINLGSEQIDLLLKPKPKKASLASLAFPIRVSGPLTAPSAGIDKEGAAVGIATAVGGVALTGGVGALLPLMSTGSGAAASGGCAHLAEAASQDKGVVGGVTDTAKDVGQGVGGAVESVTKGIGGLFGK